MRIIRRVSQWWRFRTNGADVAEEMAFHRDAIERDLIERGYSIDDARVAAQRVMGNQTLMREASRGVWLWPWLEGLMQDARSSVRGLRKSPAFTIGVVLTFALGVGANAAMFSLVDRLLFRPPGLMRDPGAVNLVSLYRVSNGVEGRTGGIYPRHADLARFSHSFSDVAAYAVLDRAVGVGQDAREVRVGIVSANFFDFFDAPPAAGRYFTAAEDAPPHGAPVAVLSHATWRTEYGRRPDVIGSTLHIGAGVYTIIGVATEGFVGLWPQRPPAVFIPVAAFKSTEGPPNWVTNYGHGFGLSTMVRRKPGVSVEAATADLNAAFVQSYRSQGAAESRAIDLERLRPRALAAPVLTARGPDRSNTASITVWLGGVTLVVLLIACANVANLMLTRALARRREIAMRIALGVSRTRLLSQLLTESMLLAFAGSALGLIAASWISAALTATLFPGAVRNTVITDVRTLAFVGIIMLAVGAITGILPLIQARRLSLTEDLKSGARAGTRHRSYARSALLVAQGALSLVLLVGAGLFVRSVQHVRDVRIGFDADSVLIVDINMRGVSLDRANAIALRERLLAASTTVPGIQHASFRLEVPFSGESSYPIHVPGIDSAGKFGQFNYNAVSADYFATMGTRILKGRGIERGDIEGTTPVMVAGASMADVLWPGEDAIGKCVRIRVDTMPCTYVVGVAGDIRTRSIGPEARFYYYYVPAAQTHPSEVGLFVRVPGDARAFIAPLRARLQREMPGTSYVTVSRLGANIEGATRSWIMGATLFTAFGLLALLLASVGVYSVIAYNIAQRRQEMAVRVALGASTANLLRLVLTSGMRFGVAGIVVGGAIAYAAAKWIEPLLFNQPSRDPAVFGLMAGVLFIVALAASLVPARRASRVDPRAVLQAE